MAPWGETRTIPDSDEEFDKNWVDENHHESDHDDAFSNRIAFARDNRPSSITQSLQQSEDHNPEHDEAAGVAFWLDQEGYAPSEMPGARLVRNLSSTILSSANVATSATTLAGSTSSASTAANSIGARPVRLARRPVNSGDRTHAVSRLRHDLSEIGNSRRYRMVVQLANGGRDDRLDYSDDDPKETACDRWRRKLKTAAFVARHRIADPKSMVYDDFWLAWNILNQYYHIPKKFRGEEEQTILQRLLDRLRPGIGEINLATVTEIEARVTIRRHMERLAWSAVSDSDTIRKGEKAKEDGDETGDGGCGGEGWERGAEEGDAGDGEVERKDDENEQMGGVERADNEGSETGEEQGRREKGKKRKRSSTGDGEYTGRADEGGEHGSMEIQSLDDIADDDHREMASRLVNEPQFRGWNLRLIHHAVSASERWDLGEARTWLKNMQDHAFRK